MLWVIAVSDKKGNPRMDMVLAAAYYDMPAGNTCFMDAYDAGAADLGFIMIGASPPHAAKTSLRTNPLALALSLSVSQTMSSTRSAASTASCR